MLACLQVGYVMSNHIQMLQISRTIGQDSPAIDRGRGYAAGKQANQRNCRKATLREADLGYVSSSKDSDRKDVVKY